jgi:uridylate kinase
MAEPVYRRVVVKLSGEYLAGSQGVGFDQPTIDRIAGEVIAAQKLGTEVAVVVGGGNVVRGVEVSSRGVSRPTGDTMGMLATMMNCLALEAAIERRARRHARCRPSSCPRFPSCSPAVRRTNISPRQDRAARRRHQQPLLHDRHDCGAAGGRNRGACSP